MNTRLHWAVSLALLVAVLIFTCAAAGAARIPGGERIAQPTDTPPPPPPTNEPEPTAAPVPTATATATAAPTPYPAPYPASDSN